jgi:MFS family permease
MAPALLASVLLIAASGLIYELVAGTLASYLLGDSVTQFSTVIGTYLFAMGIGAWLSRFVTRGVAARFILIELMVGLIGGFSSALLFLAFAFTDSFRLVLYALVVAIGTLVGLEVPLLMRILKDRYEFKDVVAHVLTFDYLGALGASLLFPIVLVPHLGLVRSALLFGLVNTAVAFWTTFLLRQSVKRPRGLRLTSAAVIVVLLAGMAYADRILEIGEGNIYADEIVLSKTTAYQRIVITAWKDDLRLFLNSNLQFSSRDEYRYHEALVHPGLAALPSARHVLVLGGGDGLAVREILKHPHVEDVTLVDLDPEMTKLFSSHPELRRLNHDSLKDPRVRKAISMAINRPAIVEKVMEGEAVPAGQLIPDFLFGATKNLKVQPFDPEGAKKLLAEAGYPDGFGLTIHAPNNRYVNDAKIAQAIAQMLTRVGVDVKVVAMPSATFFPQATDLKFSLLQAGWSTGTGEASSSLKALLMTFNREKGFGTANRCHYSNGKVDALTEDALQTVDDAKREALLQRATELAINDTGIIPLHFQVSLWATRDGIAYAPRVDEQTLAWKFVPKK